jgi:hypothetical protein
MPPLKTSPSLKYLTLGSICEQLIDSTFKIEVSSFMPITQVESWKLDKQCFFPCRHVPQQM